MEQQMASKRRRELTVGGVAVELVGADALLPVPLDEAGEVALPRARRAVQPGGGGAGRRGGRSSMVRIRETVEDRPHPRLPSHTRTPSSKSLAAKAVEVEHGPALESHPHVAAVRLDARDVAESAP